MPSLLGLQPLAISTTKGEIMSKMMIVLHVVGSVFIVGPMAILPMSGMRTLRAGDASHLATQAKSTNLLSLLSLIVAVVGFGVMGSDRPDLTFTTPWILASVSLYVVALLLNLMVVVPAMRRASTHLEGSSSQPSTRPKGLNRGYAAIAAGSGVVSLLLVVVVVLMVWQP
jgi:uncharacterized membrane protein